MKKLLIFFCSFNIIFAEIYQHNHYSGLEYSDSDILNISSNSLILADGELRFVLRDLNMDGDFTYNIRRDEHSLLNSIEYTSFGGRLQYNGIKNFVLGIKGGLDYDDFYKNSKKYFSRYHEEYPYLTKSGKVENDEDFGVKIYNEIIKKPRKDMIYGLWNEILIIDENIEKSTRVDKLNFDDGSYRDETFALTITPRFIYIKNPTENIKFVGEIYSENRIYFNKKIEGRDGVKDRRSYYKHIIVPQLIVDKKWDENKIYSYLSFENEKYQYIDYWQHKLMWSPKLSLKFNKLSFFLGGGGYEYQDEIGIKFDNKELFAFKLADRYSSRIFSIKSVIKYEIYKNLYGGFEYGYKNGSWKDDFNDGYMNLDYKIGFIEYRLKKAKYLDFSFKYSIEKYDYKYDISEEKAIPDDRVNRISIGLNYNR